MTEKIEWPPHRRIYKSHRSKLSGYRPAVARVMRQHGLRSAHELVDKIHAVIDETDVSGFFGNIRPGYREVVAMISKSNKDERASPFTSDGESYSNRAFLVAFVLDTHPDELFGQPPMNRTLKSEFSSTTYEGVLDDVPNMTDIIEFEGFEVDLDRAIASLSRKLREVFERHYGLDGRPRQTIHSIAEDMRIPAGTVKSRLSRAIEKLADPALGLSDYYEIDPYVFSKKLVTADLG